MSPTSARRTFGDRLRDNSLSLVNLGLFATLAVLMTWAGQHAYNADQVAHGEQTVSFLGYVATGQWVEALFENWESEFLQMGMYVVLTAYLIQVGSSESRPRGHAPQDADPMRHRDDPRAPAPVRRGGLALRVYENSLALLFFVLFLGSFLAHALGGHAEYNAEQVAHGDAPVSFWGFVTSSQFWFQSMQNWQSEFLAVAVLVFASVYLRQRRSPESKPVHTPHDEQG